MRLELLMLEMFQQCNCIFKILLSNRWISLRIQPIGEKRKNKQQQRNANANRFIQVDAGGWRQNTNPKCIRYARSWFCQWDHNCTVITNGCIQRITTEMKKQEHAHHCDSVWLIRPPADCIHIKRKCMLTSSHQTEKPHGNCANFPNRLGFEQLNCVCYAPCAAISLLHCGKSKHLFPKAAELELFILINTHTHTFESILCSRGFLLVV